MGNSACSRTFLLRSYAKFGANIAEGCGRGGNAEFQRFLQISMGSASELEYHLLLGRDLGLLAEEKHGPLQTQVEEIKRMLAALIRKVDAERRSS